MTAMQTTDQPMIFLYDRQQPGWLLVRYSGNPAGVRARIEAVWKRIATDLRPRHLDRIVTRTVTFDQLPGEFPAYIQGGVVGRTVVKIRG